ncbi:hypothetical protein [Aquibium microcysteis]|uniref:hypothetical protein n=1 Tax=Aquibium microcysteis TaxID=675281 RepID=UPI00165CFF95|nr:hypothetical protein [Aquibium microcysteis]
MLSRVPSSPSAGDDSSDQKVEPDVWAGFSGRRTEDVIVELVLPALSFTPKPAPTGSGEGARPGLWPMPPSSADADRVAAVFGEARERLGAMGISRVTELRSAGSMVARVDRRQLGLLAALPSVRRIYPNTPL